MIDLYGCPMPFTSRRSPTFAVAAYLCDNEGCGFEITLKSPLSWEQAPVLAFHADRCPKRPPTFIGMDLASDYVRKREADAFRRGYELAREVAFTLGADDSTAPILDMAGGSTGNAWGTRKAYREAIRAMPVPEDAP